MPTSFTNAWHKVKGDNIDDVIAVSIPFVFYIDDEHSKKFERSKC
jgi:hypothetical protein